MPIFGNLLVGGMPNIRMTPELPKTLLEYPRLTGERADRGNGASRAAEKKPDVLWGDQMSLGFEKNEIVSIENSLRSAISGLVDKPGWDINTITKSSEWQDQILPIAKQLQQRKVLYAANESMAEAKATHFYAAKEEARTKGLMDKSFTEILSDGKKYRLGKDSDNNMYYEREGIYHKAIPGQRLEKVSKPEGFKARTYMDQFNRIERTGYDILGRPAEAVYGEVYDIGTLQAELSRNFASTLTELGGGKFREMVTQIPGPAETLMDVFIKITDPRINKEVVDIVTAFAYDKLSASAKTEMRQDYYDAQDRGETIKSDGSLASYDEWKDLKIWETAQGYKRTVGGGYDYTQITGGGGAGGVTTAPDWHSATRMGAHKGFYSYQSLHGLTDAEKKSFDDTRRKYADLIDYDKINNKGINVEALTRAGAGEMTNKFRNTPYYKKMINEAQKYVDVSGGIKEDDLNRDYIIVEDHYVKKDAGTINWWNFATAAVTSPLYAAISDDPSLKKYPPIEDLVKQGKAFPVSLISGLTRPKNVIDQFGLLTNTVPFNMGIPKIQDMLQGTSVDPAEYLISPAMIPFQPGKEPVYFIAGREAKLGFKTETGAVGDGISGYLLVNNETHERLKEIDPVVKMQADVGFWGPWTSKYEQSNIMIKKLKARYPLVDFEIEDIPMSTFGDFYLIPVIRQYKYYEGPNLKASVTISGKNWEKASGLFGTPGGETEDQPGQE